MKRLPVELRIPVILGPMSGAGICTPEIVAAVSNAGGLGTLAAQYLKPDAVDSALKRVRALTDKPVALNFFSPNSRQPMSGDLDAQIRLLTPIHERLGLKPPVAPTAVENYFPEYVNLAIAHRVPIVSFTMGVIPPEDVDELHSNGAFLMGTATTVTEAMQLKESGMDGVIAQGAEAGGHRGSFSADSPALIGTMALVPQVVDATGLPVIASGGIMDGRGIVAALALGATAVQMGTAFLTCKESGAPAVYKKAVLHSTDNSTTITRAFSGRSARGIRNEFTELTESFGVEPISFPWQNALTGPMRKTAAEQGEPDLMSLWAGQGSAMAVEITAQELMQKLEAEIHEVESRLATRQGHS
jgi:nitronate monooxygenase